MDENCKAESASEISYPKMDVQLFHWEVERRIYLNSK